MGTATKIADREQRGATMSDRICSVPEQAVYRLDPPLDGHEFVVVSAELEGSYKGGLDHAEALAGAGYEIAVP